MLIDYRSNAFVFLLESEFNSSPEIYCHLIYLDFFFWKFDS